MRPFPLLHSDMGEHVQEASQGNGAERTNTAARPGRIRRFFRVALAIAILKVAYDLRPAEQPQRFPPFARRTPDAALPQVDTDIEELLRSLPTSEALGAFLKQHGESGGVRSPLHFLKTYRRSPEAFQRTGWKGPCNNFAEFGCEWGARYGYTTYLVSLWPRERGASWHQFTAACLTRNQRYLIIDNTNVTEWQGSLEEYIAKHYSHLEVLPIGGIVEWRCTQNNLLARFAGQIAGNATTMVESHPLHPDSPLVATSR